MEVSKYGSHMGLMIVKGKPFYAILQKLKTSDRTLINEDLFKKKTTPQI